MLRSSTARGVLAVVAVLALLGALRYKPWQRAGASHGEGGARQKLTVGFLPVT